VSDVNRIVIVGAGLAGDTAASTLREIGYGGAITLIGDETHRPYDRPPLSKAALISADAAANAFFHPDSWYAEKHIEIRLGDAAARIEPAKRTVTLRSSVAVPYDKLLIATGTRARRLRLWETTGAPIFYLRTLDDSAALRSVLKPGARVIVIGAGVIGLEVAASASTLGCDVTVVELADRVMARSVSPAVSRFAENYHRGKGVRIICSAQISGVSASSGRAVVELGNGERLEADVVIVGVGAEPVTELAQEAGLRVDNGILVDRYTRTSDPDIHAAGDVARFESVRHERHVRTEHWRHAIDQAAIAARVMAGGNDCYIEQPWVWSDQYDLNIQIIGESHGDTEVIRGNTDAAPFVAFQLRNGRLIGAISVNQPRLKKPIADLVAAHAAVDASVLGDPATDLKKLASLLPK
jgi:3-phenylpropionate/trans-cinnamate dioxygenase ferredoxin reductase subunit